MVKVDTEGAKFEPKKVWSAAVRRLASRVDSAVTAMRRQVDTAEGLGRSPPPSTLLTLLGPRCSTLSMTTSTYYTLTTRDHTLNSLANLRGVE